MSNVQIATVCIVSWNHSRIFLTFFQENCQCVLMHNSTRFLLRLFRICFSKCETSYGPSFYSIELPHLYVDGPDSYVSTVLNQKSTAPGTSFNASQCLTIWWTWLYIFLPAARFTIFMGQKAIRHLVSVIHDFKWIFSFWNSASSSQQSQKCETFF